jgi:hypothetical protein
MRPADALCLPSLQIHISRKKVKGKRSRFPLLLLSFFLALPLVITNVSLVSAEAKIALASPHDLDNMHLEVGQEGNFKLRVYNCPESENSLRFEITTTGEIAPFLSFSDNGFVLAPDTSKQVLVSISPIAQENVYEGDVSVFARSLGEDNEISPVVASVGAQVRVTVTKTPAPARTTTSIILIIIIVTVASAAVVSIAWLARRRKASRPLV